MAPTGSDSGDVLPKLGVTMSKSDRGFAHMDKDRQKAISRLGGIAVHKRGTGHEWTPEEASVAGKKGIEARARNIAARKLREAA